MDEAINKLCNKIKYKFKDSDILTTALTHSSYVNEKKQSLKDNERLEFLGDSVLQMLVTDYLFRHFSDRPEGELTVTRASIVCKDACAEYANKIGLGECLLLGRSQAQTDERNRVSVLADAFEALLGAMYLDGGWDSASSFMLPLLDSVVKKGMPKSNDYKTRLQEIVQRNRSDVLSYSLSGESGPPHDKVFEVELRLNGSVIGSGSGKSKKEAEQMAARQALKIIENKS